MTATHRLGPPHIHYAWDREQPPALTIDPGDAIEFECREASDGQVTPETRREDLGRRDRGRVHALTGPVAIQGARPGDVLVVEVLGFAHDGWGYTTFRPGAGLLPDDFDEPHIHHWWVARDAGGREWAEFRGLPDTGGRWRPEQPRVAVPVEPFCGIMGVSPAEPGTHRTFAPHAGGGNMDVRHLTAGSTLYLPVFVDGALFSVGDCHLAQGDGEVCVTAIEAPMRVRLRFHLRRGRPIAEPQFFTRGPLTPRVEGAGFHVVTAHRPDLMEAARAAIRHMIDHLVSEYGFSRPEAYMLCSVAVDLKLSQVVDAPNWTVSAYLPLAIFDPPALA